PLPSLRSDSRRARPPVATVAERIRSLGRGQESVAALDLPRLPASRQEAEAILAMVPADQRLGALGFNATKAAAMNEELNRYRIVHFATHTALFDDHPELSGLVLSLVNERGVSQNGFLRLRDIYNLKL